MMSSKTKIGNVGVGDVEVKQINYQQHPQGLLESQETPPQTNRKQKCCHLDDLGFTLVWWEDILTAIKSESKRGKLTNTKYSKNTYSALSKLCQNNLCNKKKQMADK